MTYDFKVLLNYVFNCTLQLNLIVRANVSTINKIILISTKIENSIHHRINQLYQANYY